MLPNDDKPWAKTLARIVICVTIVALIGLSLFLESRNMFHIPEIVGVAEARRILRGSKSIGKNAQSIRI